MLVGVLACTQVALDRGVARLPLSWGSWPATASELFPVGLHLLALLATAALAMVAARVLGVRIWRARRGDWIGTSVRACLLGSACAILAGVILRGEWIARLAWQAPGASAEALMSVPLAILPLAVVSEEMFFRGMLQRRLASVAGLGAALCLSAIGFAVMHAPDRWVTAAVASVLFGWLLHRHDHLAVPIAAHLGWNLAVRFHEAIASAMHGGAVALTLAAMFVALIAGPRVLRPRG